MASIFIIFDHRQSVENWEEYFVKKSYRFFVVKMMSGYRTEAINLTEALTDAQRFFTLARLTDVGEIHIFENGRRIL